MILFRETQERRALAPARAPVQPGVFDLYAPRWLAARRRMHEGRSVARGVLLGLVGLVFWTIVFAPVSWNGAGSPADQVRVPHGSGGSTGVTVGAEVGVGSPVAIG